MKGAKATALEDIKAELKKEHKHFIPFRKELNSTMKELVEAHILLMSKTPKNKHNG